MTVTIEINPGQTVIITGRSDGKVLIRRIGEQPVKQEGQSGEETEA